MRFSDEATDELLSSEDVRPSESETRGGEADAPPFFRLDTPFVPSAQFILARRPWRRRGQQLRALFEAATQSLRGRRSVLLWRMYARFELCLGRVYDAKKVFLRGLQVSPQSKVLWLDMLRCARPFLPQSEIDDAVSMMTSKGVLFRNEPPVACGTGAPGD